jgi:hypothetical protein
MRQNTCDGPELKQPREFFEEEGKQEMLGNKLGERNQEVKRWLL